MIARCPKCKAGHNLPATTVHEGGIEITCRRCGEAFLVSPDGGPGPVERTRVETENPFDEALEGSDLRERTAAAQFDSFPTRQDDLEAEAGDQAPQSDDLDVAARSAEVPSEDLEDSYGAGAATDQGSERGKSLVGITERAPTPVHRNQDERPTDSPTMRFASHAAHDALGLQSAVAMPQVGAAPVPVVSHASTSPEPAATDPRRESPARSPPSRPLGAGTTGASVECGLPVELAGVTSVEDVSGQVGAIEILRRLPLIVKLALATIPPLAGLLLVVVAHRWPHADAVRITATPSPVLGPATPDEPGRPGTPSPAPPVTGGRVGAVLPISNPPPSPRAALPSTAAPPPRSATATAARPIAPAAPPGPDLGGLHVPDDPRAREGHAYVQVAGAPLRATTSAEGPLVATLEAGTLVKNYDGFGDFRLVVVVPSGPAGFVCSTLLGDDKPVVRLAKEIGFGHCAEGERVPLDTCLYQAKQRDDDCLRMCATVAHDDSISGNRMARCAEACGIAFSDCQRECRDNRTPKKKDPKPSHRPK